MRPDWVKLYHDKVTKGWINYVYPVNKGNMTRVTTSGSGHEDSN